MCHACRKNVFVLEVREKEQRLHLIEHLGRLVRRGTLICSGVVHSQAEERVVLCFKSWVNINVWKPGISSAAFLLHLRPHAKTNDEKSEYNVLEQACKPWLGRLEGNDLFSLRNCVMALPPPLDENISSPHSVLKTEDKKEVFPIHLLPDEVMFRVLGFLDHKALQSLAQTCQYFRMLCGEITPGLLLRLYPHQRAAIRWMIEREKGGALIDHPSWRFFETEAWSFWGNTSTGEISEDPPPAFEDFKGGFLCDDPGLGKTVTCIGLMTRTKGHLPALYTSEEEISWYNSSTNHVRYGYISTHYTSSFHESDRQHSKRRKVASQSKFSPFKHAAASRRKSNSSNSTKVATKLTFDGTTDDATQDSWIQCDLCNAWRRLPPGHAYGGKEWCCYLHPVSRLRSCAILPEVLGDEEEVISMHGWVSSSEEPCKSPNVELFKEALAKHGELFSVYGRYKHKGRTILHWLMSKSPEDFHDSFILPSWAQQPSGFGNFLKTIGFVQVEMCQDVASYNRVGNKRPAGHHK